MMKFTILASVIHVDLVCNFELTYRAKLCESLFSLLSYQTDFNFFKEDGHWTHSRLLEQLLYYDFVTFVVANVKQKSNLDP